MRTAVLFDIDGTLLKAGGAGREALARGAAAALGVTLDEARGATLQMDFRGRIDPVLVRELAGRLGHDGERAAQRITEAYLAALPGTLARAVVEVMPGVVDLVARLEARPRTLVGLLTGNVREGARLKLGAVGLERLAERPGGFGADGGDRAEVAQAAAARAFELGVPAERVFVVGDTEHDVAAARAGGMRAVAVATGWTDAATLAASLPDLLLPDLADHAPFFALLDRGNDATP